MLIKSDICQIESFILCKSVGQQNTEQAQYHLLNFLKIRRHKFVELSNNQVLVVSTFGTVCGTRRDRQKGNWSEKDLGRVPLHPLHPSHPFHPPYTLGRTLVIPHTLAKWNTFSTKAFLFCNRKVFLNSQNFSKRPPNVPTCDRPPKKFQIVIFTFDIGRMGHFFFLENFPLSLQLSSVATRTVAMQMRACRSDDPHFLLTQADMDISAS